MDASDVLMQDLYNLMSKPKKCEKTKEEWKEKLLKEMRRKENKAFNLTASVTPPFICHPDQLLIAENEVKIKHGIHQIEYPAIQKWDKG